MKKLKFSQLLAAIAIMLGLTFQSCSKDSTSSSEDLTVTIVGTYMCQVSQQTGSNYTVIGSNISTLITKENNTTIKIAITGRETVTATVSKQSSYFLIDVIDQAGITNGHSGDFGNNEINFGYTKETTVNGITSSVVLGYYGTKQ